MRVGTVGDPAALRLLNKTMDFLEKQKQFDNNGATTLNGLSDTLKIIQLSLARIEHKDPIPPESRNYATVVAQNSSKDSETSTMLPWRKDPQQAPKNKVPTLKKAHQAREITVHIGNKAEKEKVKMLSTKDLVEALQAETQDIWEVSRLISGDIKIHVESLEAKKALQKQTGWIQKMAKSAMIHVRTFLARANGVRVGNVNIANQAKAIEYLQTANACLHPGLKIAKLTWSARAIREGKTYSILHIEVATAAIANQLIRKVS